MEMLERFLRNTSTVAFVASKENSFHSVCAGGSWDLVHPALGAAFLWK